MSGKELRALAKMLEASAYEPSDRELGKMRSRAWCRRILTRVGYDSSIDGDNNACIKIPYYPAEIYASAYWIYIAAAVSGK